MLYPKDPLGLIGEVLGEFTLEVTTLIKIACGSLGGKSIFLISFLTGGRVL